MKKNIIIGGAVAAVLALGTTGGAVAGTMIGGGQIKNNTVRSVDLMDGKGVSIVDFKPGLKKRFEAAENASGKDGADGKDGVSGFEVHNREIRLTDNTATAQVDCPAGKVALGGGFVAESIRGGTAVVHSSEPVFADGSTTGWKASATATGNVNLKVWTTCALAN